MLLSAGIVTSITAAIYCYHVRFVRQQLLVCLEVEFPQDPSPVVLNNFWRCLPSGLRDFRFTHGTYAPVLGLPSKTTDSVQQR